MSRVQNPSVPLTAVGGTRGAHRHPSSAFLQERNTYLFQPCF